MLRALSSTVHLFSAPKFRIHRLWGIVYLFQFGLACAFEVMGTPRHALFWTMPLTGLIQSIIACRTFTFLPKANDKEQGYYTDTKVMSYDFILENIYFAGLLLFQSCYLCFAREITTNPVFLPLEIVGVFFPYYTLRGFFPKSSFRHTTKTGNKYAMVVKVFYCIAKHFSGYYVNYLCFLGHFGETPIMTWSLIRKLFLLGGWGTTIAMFLQTLKFRKYISPRAAQILYAGSFPLFYSCYAALFYIAVEHAWLTMLTLIGLAVNFLSTRVQIGWQSVMCMMCLCIRFNMIPEAALTI